MWFMYALITALCWGGADLFYKKGADENEAYSHLKTSIMVGLVMGIHAIVVLLTADFHYDPINLLIYAPVSLMYILSMTIGYFGLKYLEVSLSSPIQNSSGVVVSLLCFLFLQQTMDLVPLAAVILIAVGIFLLGVLEKRKQKEYELQFDKKYRIGFVAFLMPIFYCIIDAMGTFFDAFYLDDFETTPLSGVTEDSLELVANTSYELTFLLIAAVLFIYVCVIKKQKLWTKNNPARTAAALLETGGQFTYVYAMSGNAIVAAPMIACYSIFSILFARIFIREKLSASQYAVIALVLAGIAVLGIYDI